MPAKRNPTVLFSPEQVEWLKVDKERKIGEGHQGTVYVGRIKFLKQPSRQVAVKVFKEQYPLSGLRLKYLQRIIEDFRRVGVAMPKFGVVEHKGENVLVSNLFSRKQMRGSGELKSVSKMTEMAELPMLQTPLKDGKVARTIAKQLGLMMKAGWAPRNYQAVFHIYSDPAGKKVIVGEIDPFHYHKIPLPTTLTKTLEMLKGFLDEVRNQTKVHASALRTIYSLMPAEYRKEFLKQFELEVHPTKKITLGEILRKKSRDEINEIYHAWMQKVEKPS